MIRPPATLGIVPKRSRKCLRCDERAATRGWQCAQCASEFEPLTDRDRAAALDFLDEQERLLSRAADRLDGAGFWAAAKVAWAAQERVAELGHAISDEDPAEEK